MAEEIIDIHVHYGSPVDEETGCYWSQKFEETAAYFAMLLVTKSIFKKVSTERIKTILFNAINESKYVNKSVLLALDAVYDENGNKHEEWTHMYVPNSFVQRCADTNDRILFGASVHPYRPDWQQELENCLQNGAVVCKWVPSSQQINPADAKCEPIYQKLAECGLPLLCHSGPEYTIPTSNDMYNEYNNPKYLRKALEMGVNVIIAHCALPYFWFLDVDYQDDFDDFINLVRDAQENNWNLYADLSAVATTLRSAYMETVVEVIPPEHLLFGSDFPIPASALCYNKSKKFFPWLFYILKMMAMGNPLDKNYQIIKEMGFADSVFTNAQRLFSNIKR